jgi:hypothetical protein
MAPPPCFAWSPSPCASRTGRKGPAPKTAAPAPPGRRPPSPRSRSRSPARRRAPRAGCAARGASTCRRPPRPICPPGTPPTQKIRLSIALVGEPVAAEILAGHAGGDLPHPRLAEAAGEQGDGRIGQLRGVEGRRGEDVLDVEPISGIRSSGTPAAIASPRAIRCDAVEQQLSGLVGEAPHGQQQLRLVGDDVVLGAGVEAADGDHAGSAGRSRG